MMDKKRRVECYGGYTDKLALQEKVTEDTNGSDCIQKDTMTNRVFEDSL